MLHNLFDSVIVIRQFYTSHKKNRSDINSLVPRSLFGTDNKIATACSVNDCAGLLRPPHSKLDVPNWYIKFRPSQRPSKSTFGIRPLLFFKKIMRNAPFGSVFVVEQFSASHEKNAPTLKPDFRFSTISVFENAHNFSFRLIHLFQPCF